MNQILFRDFIAMAALNSHINSSRCIYYSQLIDEIIRVRKRKGLMAPELVCGRAGNRTRAANCKSNACLLTP